MEPNSCMSSSQADEEKTRLVEIRKPHIGRYLYLSRENKTNLANAHSYVKKCSPVNNLGMEINSNQP